MNFRTFIPLASLALFFSAGAVPTFATPANAKCGAADSAMKPIAMTPAMTGNADRDFARVMMAHERAMVAMARTEVACGTNPAARSAAQAFLDDARERMKTMELIAHTN